MKFLFIVLMLTASAAVFAADNFAKDLCAKVSALGPSLQDKKNSGIKLNGENCSSESYYYGLGRPVDYVKARLCAFEETADQAFGSNGILMMIYANGYGVSTNIPLAESYACAMDTPGADMYQAGRLQHLEKMKTDSSLKIDICDDDGSSYMTSECTGHSNRVARLKQDHGFKDMMKTWTAGEKSAFQKLKVAASKFSDLRAHKEVSLQATARATIVQEEEGSLSKDFSETLKNFEKDQVLAVSAEDYKTMDDLLNANYTKIRQSKDPEDGNTITKDGVQETQKAWLRYRDAWLAFAKLKYPKISSDSVAALLTKKRNAMLQNLLVNPFSP